jgi:hypothetical protein
MATEVSGWKATQSATDLKRFLIVFNVVFRSNLTRAYLELGNRARRYIESRNPMVSAYQRGVNIRFPQ